ncbi:DUF6510 family protein [Krasilnikoviella flava]|uniref:MJ0042 family finger-like domain-containing protein n=1 Tax=Krasilnikoviella flava TaxID=526729 RepID=A0A1T5JYT7_9MICO|nr:DUF6510 family protein [Krasilnikoviella flava]SKC56490.1 hypothetical protein SAMN04324258_1663 [Krasilnikoviella flava]
MTTHDAPVHDRPTLDGSALAGLLSEVYAFDATLAVVRCASCGHTDVFARATVYLTAMGAVVRCATCTAVLLVVVERPDGPRVSASGAAWVQAPGG